MDESFNPSLPFIRTMGTQIFEPQWAERMHAPNSMEVLHVVDGVLTLVFENETFKAGPGQTLLVPRNVPHRDEFDIDAGLEIFFCSLEWENEEEFFRTVDNATLLKMPDHRQAEISTLFDQLRADLAGTAPADKIVAQARLLTILLIMRREAAARTPHDPFHPVAEPTYGQTRRKGILRGAKSYLERHYAELVSLDDVARELQVSPYYLSHVFSEESDFSLFSYLTSLRMEKAQALLREGRMNVSEVATAVGYESANYFSKVFKKHCGESPREFAAQNAL